MTDRDAFWAAKILMRFTEDELPAIVRTGQSSNPEAERYFHQVLVERQRKSARKYTNRVNPIDEFKVTAEGLRFANLSERYRFAEPGTTYEVAWSVYDNATDTVVPLADPVTRTDTVVPAPANPSLTGDTDLRAEIRSRYDDFPS